MGNIALPSAFLEEMKTLLSAEEYPLFLEAMSGPRSYGLRRNPLKYSREEFEARMPYTLQAVPWTREGYFYDPAQQPGKSPFHEAGAFYIQEPSAMEVVELLDPEPGDYVCDLCAAPGGKSSQIAGRLAGTGFLLSNEYVASRAKILAQNLERMGAVNYMITNEDTGVLGRRFPLFFDKIVVDAPCSGEGMFRKDDIAITEWSPENVRLCADRQQEILDNAAKMLKPGGVMVYSTCTFSVLEDEQAVLTFLASHQDFYLDEAIPSKESLALGICSGKIPGTEEKLPGTVRMWPHKIQGEGHFAARLIRKSTSAPHKSATQQEELMPSDAAVRGNKKAKAGKEKGAKQSGKTNPGLLDFQNFCRETLTEHVCLEGTLHWFGDQLYLLPIELDFTGLKVERAGLHLGTARKNRFEPSHTWAMTLTREDVQNTAELKNPLAFMQGQTDYAEGKGWTLALMDGRPVGWGKALNGVLKNHYPKGLRKP